MSNRDRAKQTNKPAALCQGWQRSSKQFQFHNHVGHAELLLSLHTINTQSQTNLNAHKFYLMQMYALPL